MTYERRMRISEAAIHCGVRGDRIRKWIEDGLVDAEGGKGKGNPWRLPPASVDWVSTLAALEGVGVDLKKLQHEIYERGLEQYATNLEAVADRFRSFTSSAPAWAQIPDLINPSPVSAVPDEAPGPDAGRAAGHLNLLSAILEDDDE